MPESESTVPRDRAGNDGREALWRTLQTVLQRRQAAPPLERIGRDRPPEASFGQQRLWFIERLMPGSAMHNQTIAYRLLGQLSIPALERALGEIVRRHEILRTTLRWSDGALIQHIHPASAFAIAVEDLQSLAPTERTSRVERETALEARTPFDLDRPPLLRAKLFRLTHAEYRLELTVQHLAFDGWSFDVFMGELCTLYAAFVANARSPLSELRYQYADWSAWQRARLQGEARDRLLAYWQEQMRDAPTELRMATDRPRRGLRMRRGEWQTFQIGPSLTLALKALAAREGSTSYMMLLAAFQAFLHRYTGQDDIVVGSPVANRDDADAERLIGLLVNTLPMRIRVDGRESFRELLARVRRTVLMAYEHQALPFEVLVQAMGPASRSDATPIFQTMFAFQNLPRSDWRMPGLSVQAWNVCNGAAKFDFTLFMWDASDGFAGLLEYDTDLFDAETTEQWLRHLKALLQSIVCDPDAPIQTLPLLDDAERSALLHTWNATAVPYPRDLPIHRVFGQRARESPSAPALVCESCSISYGLLERRANRLGRHLQGCGAAPGSLIGVCLERSPGLIVALLAILKAGGAFVPVDPTWPAERIKVVLDGIPVVVTQDSLAHCTGALDARIVRIDGDAESIERESDEPLEAEVSAEGLAYVMFTSGSTGLPKGVCVRHRGVVRLVRGANYADLGPTDTLLQLAPVAFDASTFEIWGALLNGATLAMPLASRVSLGDIAETIRTFKVSVLWLSSGLFEAMVDTHLDDLRHVRQLLVGGDVLSPGHAERFLRAVPGCRLVNCYGPTENTTFTTFHAVQQSSCASGGSIPIGRPVSNTQVYVLDNSLQPVPIGATGNAYVGGDGLMRGYLRDPTGTLERLVRNPFQDCPGEWLYHTGDLVRRRRDGELEFLGRGDHQVKIRGFRVEPGEVESVLSRCPLVRSTAVIAAGDSPTDRRLLAFVVPGAAAKAEEEAICEMRDFVRHHLPGHLVPSEFLMIDALPLSANGKVDRQRLRAIGENRSARADNFVAPRDARERIIVRAFEAILGVGSIGVDDDFFDSGGSSLAALRLVAMLEDAFGVSLPLASLYEHPTPARLAVLIAHTEVDAPSARARGEEASVLVEIKRGSAASPLFLVPGGHGGMAEMTLYARVLSRVRYDHAVYGFVAQGLDGEAQPHASVEEMARAYVAAMRGRQPHGPYLLAGECVGGLIAFEMAHQLLSQGEEIALLLLLDTWCPTRAGVLHYRHVERTATLLAGRYAVTRAVVAGGLSALRRRFRDRSLVDGRSLRDAVDVCLKLPGIARAWLTAVYRVGRPVAGMETIAAAEENYVKRTMGYRPRHYPGRATLVLCADNQRRGLAKRWRALVEGGLVVRSVPGDHDSYLRSEARYAATAIEDCLRGALVAGTLRAAAGRKVDA
jgi:amino acid adenylation domain-containing protein